MHDVCKICHCNSFAQSSIAKETYEILCIFLSAQVSVIFIVRSMKFLTSSSFVKGPGNSLFLSFSSNSYFIDSSLKATFYCSLYASDFSVLV